MIHALFLAQQDADNLTIDGSLVITVLVIIVLVLMALYFWRRR